MALRVAMGMLAALRAVLIYGEADGLAQRPLAVPRLRGRRRTASTPPWSAPAGRALPG